MAQGEIEAPESMELRSRSASYVTTGEREEMQRGAPWLGFNLAYTINLNLPASTDQAVFNAIFRSLKEHLLAQPE